MSLTSSAGDVLVVKATDSNEVAGSNLASSRVATQCEGLREHMLI